jgi:ABC-type xylose transport system permease subunit
MNDQNLQDRDVTASKPVLWLANAGSFLFILLQSACTAVMAISGFRLLIGLGALAAAGGVYGPAKGFHQDAIRIPMMVVAVVGALANLYSVWRVRSLRARPASQWRVQPISRRKLRSEWVQIVLAIVTLVLVAAEWMTHTIIHRF